MAGYRIAWIAGLAAFVVVWTLIAKFGGRIPDPVIVAKQRRRSSPTFLRKGERPGHRLERAVVAAPRRHRLQLAALVGIPLGFIIGRFRFAPACSTDHRAAEAVSPLAWLPIGLLAFKAANRQRSTSSSSAACADDRQHRVGVRQIPQDYLNVARVLNLSEWKVFTKILFPAVLPT